MSMGAGHWLILTASAAAVAIALSAASLARAEETQQFVMPKFDPDSPLSAARAKEMGSDDVPKFDPRMVQGGAIPADQLPAAPANGELTFVFADFTWPVYPGWDNCPKGWAYTNKEQYLAPLPYAEQARLLQPENEIELTDKWKLRAAPGDRAMNVCSNYNEFPQNPLQFPVEGNISFGLNLDGDAGENDPYVCGHQNFESPLGEAGIDNQIYRAMGCTRTWRGPDGIDGEAGPGYTGMLTTGQFTVVLILRDVDSLANDDHVEVILASSDEQPIIDVSQNILGGVSFRVGENPEYRNELRGRIVDGVLMTESKDILLERSSGGFSGGSSWDLERAQLRFAFRSDGGLEGMLGGYELPYDVIRTRVGGGRGSALTAGLDCAAQWNTMKYFADGARDAETGQCTRLSNAYKVRAVPAFIFDRPRAAQTN